jgi:hypothetical protein
LPQERRSAVKEGSRYPGNRAEIVLPRTLLAELLNQRCHALTLAAPDEQVYLNAIEKAFGLTFA